MCFRYRSIPEVEKMLGYEVISENLYSKSEIVRPEIFFQDS